MAVYLNTDSLPYFNKAVLTIGTFDGVHLGHQAILNEVVKHAKEIGGESVLITFEPHPRRIIFPNEKLSLLTPLPQKIEYLLSTGVDHVVVQPFTQAFSRLTASQYIEQFLVDTFQPHSIVIGYDHHFGADRRGDIALLNSYVTGNNFEVHQIPAQMIEHAAISSTKIRSSLDTGDVRSAASMLGRHYRLDGTVIKGAQLGRTLGFPTANITPSDEDKLIPSNGVYAAVATVDNKGYSAMLNIGVRPTVSQELQLHIEAHLFNFSEDIYNRQIQVSFIDRLRDEQKFPSLDALKAQLAVDAENAQRLLSLV